LRPPRLVQRFRPRPRGGGPRPGPSLAGAGGDPRAAGGRSPVVPVRRPGGGRRQLLSFCTGRLGVLTACWVRAEPGAAPDRGVLEPHFRSQFVPCKLRPVNFGFSDPSALLRVCLGLSKGQVLDFGFRPNQRLNPEITSRCALLFFRSSSSQQNSDQTATASDHCASRADNSSRRAIFTNLAWSEPTRREKPSTSSIAVTLAITRPSSASPKVLPITAAVWSTCFSRSGSRSMRDDRTA